MKTKHIIPLLALLLLLSASASARKTKKKDKAATETAKSDTTKAKSRKTAVYPKVFKKQGDLQSACHRDLSLYIYENKVYMELPVRNFGREFFMSSVFTKSNIPILTGSDVNDANGFIMNRTDTIITFSRRGQSYRIADDETGVRKGVATSATNAVYHTQPIVAWSADSSRVLFEVTSMMSASNKDVLDLKDKSYELGSSIKSASIKGNLSYYEGVETFSRCVCLNQSVTGSLTLNNLMGESAEKPALQATMQTMVCLLPAADEMMPTREANASVGTGYVSYNDFRNLDNTKRGYYAMRRNYTPGDTITFYVDTLLTRSWQGAVQKAAEAWNDAFDKQGLGRPLVLKPYPKCASFNANDPLENIIALSNSSSQSVTFSRPIDPRTGEVLSTHIFVPRSIADYVRRYGICKMAEVDSRYRTYDLPDDLLCEILQALTLKVFGYSFGLSGNLAGSAAYSIDQLRSPEFTQKNGITASVMDSQIFNYVAKAGDRERGVVLTQNKPGVCDEFVIKYLYTPGVDNETLSKWVRQVAGDPRYLCGKRTLRYAPDPRCQTFDMSNDQFNAARTLMEHYKYVALNSSSWFDWDKVPDTFRELFPEFLMNDYFSLVHSMSMYIGGVYQNEYIDGGDVTVTRSVPKELQRKAVKEMYYELNEVSWLDTNPDFFQIASPCGDIAWWTKRQNLIMKYSLGSRLPYMDMSIDHSTDPYTQNDLLYDISDYVFSSVKKGKTPTGEDIYNMYSYVGLLTANNEVAAGLSKAKLSNGASSGLETVSGVEPTSEIKYYHRTDLTPLVLQKLREARPLLVRAKALAKGEADKSRVDFIILAVDRVLKK